VAGDTDVGGALVSKDCCGAGSVVAGTATATLLALHFLYLMIPL
jgi:hypothetical protein